MELHDVDDLERSRIYLQSTKGINVYNTLAELTPNNLYRHRIIRIPKRKRAHLTVYLLNINNNGMMAEYRVCIDELRVYVKLFNLHLRLILASLKIG
jgi:hypothetical protein